MNNSAAESSEGGSGGATEGGEWSGGAGAPLDG